jgi:hypothetical protein
LVGSLPTVRAAWSSFCFDAVSCFAPSSRLTALYLSSVDWLEARQSISLDLWGGVEASQDSTRSGKLRLEIFVVNRRLNVERWRPQVL